MQPLLIFGGCYSNLDATLALKNWAEKRNILPEQCVCTGDIIAYCGNPVETTELLQDWGVHCIQGNVEQSLAEKTEDCGCGFEPGTVCDVLSRDWFSFANKAIKQTHREWFHSLPEQLRVDYAGKQIRIVHGSVSNISQFMFESQAEEDFKREFELSQADIIIAGHSGIPFTKRINEKIWHNSGALGMPANDGTSRVWFSLLHNDKCDTATKEQITFTHHYLEYDCQKARQTMLNNNLTQGYHEAIINGLWPSMDVLPQVESARQGQSIRF